MSAAAIATQQATIQIAEIAIAVTLKDVKNVHLNVMPPDGAVRVSAPLQSSLDVLRAFLISKLGWIRREQQKFRDQPRQPTPLLIDRESHWVWGNRLLLKVVEADGNPWVRLSPHELRLQVRPGSDRAKRAEVLAAWYRAQVYDAVGKLLPEWEARLGVEVAKVHVRHMKTKWGSCNPAKRTIRLNTQLAKVPRRCLEYVVVHEMAHLIEPNHGPRFKGLLDTHLPMWRAVRDELNRSRLDAEDWGKG
jgi:predicted metal-dependent hydrolase